MAPRPATPQADGLATDMDGLGTDLDGRSNDISTARSDVQKVQLGRLLVTGRELSIDNLAVGFALGTYHVGLPLAAAVIGTVSVVKSLAGLELGARIGMRAGSVASSSAA